MHRFFAKLNRVETIALETKFFDFEFDEDHQGFDFIPGQFLTALVADSTYRAYSICSTPALLPKFQIVIKLIAGGVGSTYFDNLEVGDKVEFRGPFGHFVLPDDNRDKVCICTGAGIAPMRSFWKTVLSKNSNQGIHIIFGFRHEDHGVFVDEMSEMSINHHSRFAFELAVSRPINDHFSGIKGRVTDVVIKKTSDFFQEKDIFICGSRSMQEQVVEILTKEKGVNKENIFYEIY